MTPGTHTHRDQSGRNQCYIASYSYIQTATIQLYLAFPYSAAILQVLGEMMV